jgi:hypothetical protein
MNFTEIATEIVKKSIRSAICIDDQFAEPYEENKNGFDAEIPKKLYKSFREDGNCSLDFFRYKDYDDWITNRNWVLSNKDLIILDWELDEEIPKYTSTLKIIEDIVCHGRNQFLIIYTHLPNIENIAIDLQAYYLRYNKPVLKEKFDIIKEKYEESGHDFDELKLYIKKNISQVEIFSTKLNLPKIFSALGNEDFSSFMKNIRTVLDDQKPRDLLEVILLNIYGKDEVFSPIPRKVNIVSSNYLLLNIENTIILISKKGNGVQNEKNILPENLFDFFSIAIIEKPSSVLALIACEMKDVFRSNITYVGNRIQMINEKVFFYHWNNLRNTEDFTSDEADNHFKSFLLETWVNEITHFSINSSSQTSYFNALLQYGNEKGLFENLELDSPIEDLIRLGSHYSNSNSNLNFRADKKCKFGDIFWLKSNKNKENLMVLLNVTQHCDSLRPNKINNLLFFVKGEILNSDSQKKEALNKAESGYYSFIISNDIPYCIKWITKPFTIFINNESNIISETIKAISIGENEYDLEYIASLKENYTQRVANHSFGQAMRIGITLPTFNIS